MTENNRLATIERVLALLLDGEKGISLDMLQPSTKEFLTLAFREKRLLGPVGICGFPCDGGCQTCEFHTKSLAEHFANVTLREEEAKEDELWEEQQRRNKEIDDINMTAAKELPDDHDDVFVCRTCGSECISYEDGGGISWLCEPCYYGNQAQEIGYCGFPCGFGCPTCDTGGYDGADEI